MSNDTKVGRSVLQPSSHARLSPYALLTFAALCFVFRHRGEPLLKWDHAQKHMARGLFYLCAGGTVLGEILSQTGSAKYVADLLIPFTGAGGFRAVLLFSLITIVTTQITSNTAAIAIMVPITISTFQSLELKAYWPAFGIG